VLRLQNAVCAVCFQDFCNSWKSFLYTHTVLVVIIELYTFWKQDSQSRRRTSKHHWRACRSSTLYAVCTSNLSNRIMVQWIQLLASSIVHTVRWYYDENQFAFLYVLVFLLVYKWCCLYLCADGYNKYVRLCADEIWLLLNRSYLYLNWEMKLKSKICFPMAAQILRPLADVVSYMISYITWYRLTASLLSIMLYITNYPD